jgi:hypothetical protein
MKKLCILFFVFLIISSCIHTKITQSGINKIEFGSGGGFTGKYKSFIIDMKQGLILNSDESVKRILTKKEKSFLLKKLKSTDFSKIDFNHPHNMNYYISFEGSFNNKIVWGDPGHPAPDKVKELYNFLNELVK